MKNGANLKKTLCKIKNTLFGAVILPITGFGGGGGSKSAPTEWIYFEGSVSCKKDPWANLQNYIVYFYAGGTLSASAEINEVGGFSKSKFQTTTGLYTFQLVNKKNGYVVDQVKFEQNSQRSFYMVPLNACP